MKKMVMFLRNIGRFFKKRHFIGLVIFLWCSSCFAVDTDLGQFKLTEKQFSRIKSLKNANIQGFSYHQESGKVIVVSLESITPGEIDWLKTQINSFPDAYLQEDLDAQAADDAAREVIFQKMKISKDEWERIKKEPKRL